MTQSISLDSIDLRILRELQDDAGQSINEIAVKAHISQNACWRRIRILEEAGVIRGRVALLDPGKLDCGVTVFVSLKAGEHSRAWLEGFAEQVAKMPEVVEFYRMAGEIDYLLKLLVKDIAAYDEVYKQLIGAARLLDVSASFAMEEIKQTHAIPLPQASARRARRKAED